MLNQNVTTLLAALVGGFLSALGGFLANYYTSNTADRISKKKEIRNILDKMYKDTQEIMFCYRRIDSTKIKIGMRDENNDKCFADIHTHLMNIRFLVYFYLPMLKNEFNKFDANISALEEAYLMKSRSDVEEIIGIPLYKETAAFQESIINFFKKAGYNYF